MDSIKGLIVIPNYQQFMRPFLGIAQEANSNEIKLRNVINRLTSKFALTEYEKAEILSSSKQSILDNRVGWALTYITKAGLLEVIRRALFIATSSFTPSVILAAKDLGMRINGKELVKLILR